MFENLRSSDFGKRIARTLLAIDSLIDSSVYESGRSARETYESFSTFMHRFHISGWRRGFVELVSEGLDWAIVGGFIALALAIPAFQETSDDWLKKQDLAVTFVDRYGQEVGRRGIRHDDSVSFDQIPQVLIQAVLATEDRRFFEHFGIDPIGTVRALSANARANGVVQGGSTITQQLAKNLFLSNERSIERKIKEAYLALWLEFHLPKREILRLYLDRVYMGGGTFGVQAAADFYFGKSVRDLTLSEAAMLAGLFKAPTKYAPHINLPAARARANDVLSNMVEAGYLTEGQIYAAQRNPATPIDRNREISPDWYLDWAFEEIKKLAADKKLGEDRVLLVRTALDLNLQKHAEATIEEQLRQHGQSFHASQSAAVILEPLGAVRAIVGGRDYGASQFNRAIYALRQPGSSFKPFVYLTALMTGRFKPTTIVQDAPICLGDWCPRNYGGSYAGALPLINALARSLNTVAVRLSVSIGEADPRPGHNNIFETAKRGRAKIIDTARRMGITTPLIDTVSLPIGAAEVTVIDMATAYSVFANDGKRIYPYAAVEITNSRGDLIYTHDRDAPAPQQIINPATIETMDTMLMQVVEAGTGRRAKLDNFETAGKTGTTNGYKDAWFVGFTGNYVGAVWFGNDDDTPMNNMTGGTLPAGTWHDIMAFAHQGVTPKPLPGRSAPALVAAAPTAASQGVAQLGSPQRPATLSPRSAEVLGSIAETFKAIQRKNAAADAGPLASPGVRSLGGRIEVR